MKLLQSIQIDRIDDPVRSKFAMVAPVLEATVFSLRQDRVDRLGGIAAVTLQDLAREVREGHGDAGICFEFAVHEAIANQHPLIHSLASEVLDAFCGIAGGCDSILFGPEKEGRIPILESVENALTDDSRVYVGKPWSVSEAEALHPLRSSVPSGATRTATDFPGALAACGRPTTETFLARTTT